MANHKEDASPLEEWKGGEEINSLDFFLYNLDPLFLLL